MGRKTNKLGTPPSARRQRWLDGYYRSAGYMSPGGYYSGHTDASPGPNTRKSPGSAQDLREILVQANKKEAPSMPGPTTVSLDADLKDLTKDFRSAKDDLTRVVTTVGLFQWLMGLFLLAICTAIGSGIWWSATLNGAVRDLDARSIRVDGRLEKVEARLSGVETRLSGVEAQLKEVGSRLDRLEAGIGRILDRLPAPAGDRSKP